MYRESSSHIKQFKEEEYKYYRNNDIKLDVWRVLDETTMLSENAYLMAKTTHTDTQYALLYLHSFPMIVPKRIQDAQLLERKYTGYEKIDLMTDRLKWLRHKKGMMQKELAGVIGCTVSHYRDIESGRIDCIDKMLVDKISKFYEIQPETWLDEYNMFLYYGQAVTLKKFREKLGLGKKTFCKQYGIQVVNYRDWEMGRKRMTKESFEKHFKNILNM